MKSRFMIGRALVLSALVASSAMATAQSATSSDKVIFGSQPNFMASVRMKVPGFECALQYGRLARIGDKARVDMRPFVGKGQQVDCNPGPPIQGKLFSVGEAYWTDKVVVVDHTKRTWESRDDAIGVPVAAPYALMMGWLATGSVTGATRLEGEQMVNGHPCIVISDIAKGELPWTRYYAATDLRNLVIRIEWGSHGGDAEGLMPRFLPRSGELELSEIVLDPPLDVVSVPKGYRRARVR